MFVHVADGSVTPRPHNDIDLVCTYPIYSARVTADGVTQAQSFAFQDFPNDPAFYLSGYTNRGSPVESTANSSIGSVTSFADGYPPSYQATQRIFQAPLPSPSGVSYRSNPSTHSHVIQDPFHTNLDRSTIIPPYSTNVTYPPTIPTSYQASSHFVHFAGNVVSPPSPPPTVSPVNEVPVTTASNTIRICQCSSACNAVLDGNIQAVRNHLKQEHQFRGGAKESTRCPWSSCKRILQRENIPRHILTRHLRVTVSCLACGTTLSRRDVRYSHARVCRARRHTSASASQLRPDVSSPTAPSTNPTLSDRNDVYYTNMTNSFPIPYAPFDMATTLGWAPLTIPIAANPTRSSGHTLRVSIPPLGYLPYQPPVMEPGLPQHKPETQL